MAQEALHWYDASFVFYCFTVFVAWTPSTVAELYIAELFIISFFSRREWMQDKG
jgi:hypothetical protein